MAFEDLKAAVQAVVTDNDNKEITGALLRQLIIDNIIPHLGVGQYKGLALPTTVPPAYQQDVFYFAAQAGTYSNFGGANVPEGLSVLKFNSPGGWTVQELVNTDAFTTGLNDKTDKGGYPGTTQDLKDELDALVFTGTPTYQTQAELPTSPVPANGTAAIVANDPTTTLNGGWAVAGGAWVQNYVDLGDTVVSNTTATAAALTLTEGKLVKTKGRDAISDGGSAFFEVRNTFAHTDEQGLGFTLPNGKVLVNISERVTAAHFGVFPDGATNWESTQPIKVNALKAAALIKRVWFKGGDYKTSINLNNLSSGFKIGAYDGVASFGGIFHFLSGSGVLQATEITSLSSAAGVITVTFASAHGMNDSRNVFFNTTGTGLDTGSYLATITTTTAFTITSGVDVSGYGGSGGYAKDMPLDGVSLLGSFRCYDRFGFINCHNLEFDHLIQGSDATKHVSGTPGRGGHFYFDLKNIKGKLFTVEDTGLQSEVSNTHAGLAVDGANQSNIHIDRVHVIDSGVNGVVIQSNNFYCPDIQVDAYGRGAMTEAPVNNNFTDVHGKATANMACGVWVIRGLANLGSVNVKNKDSRGNALNFVDRPDVYADVNIGRNLINWNFENTSFLDSRASSVIQNITCENVLNMALAGDDQFGNSLVQNLNVFAVAPDNPMLTTPTEKAKYGLIFHTKGRMSVQKANFPDIDLSLAWRSHYSGDLNSFFSIKNVYVQNHASTLGLCGNNFEIEGVYANDRKAGDSDYSLIFEDNSNRTAPSFAKRLKLMNLAGVDAKAIDFSTDYATIENFYLHNYGSATGAAFRFTGRMSKVAQGYMMGNSIAGADGFEYNNPYRGRTESLEVVGWPGTGVVGTGSNLIATNCIATGNGTASSLAVANLVSGCRTAFGNFAWSV